MKKTRKILSIVLAVLFAFSSMPVVYVGTGAADAVTYAAGEPGTIDNPTVPVSESGEYRQDEVNHLTAIQKSLNFTFYQTRDDEYFKLSQLVQMEKYCGSFDSITVMINGYHFGNDSTSSNFFNNHKAEFAWEAGTDESAQTAFPNTFEARGNIISCPDYSWSLEVLFRGSSADNAGEINIGYSHILDYRVKVGEEAETSYQTPINTTIKILDARELVEKMAEAEEIIKNSDEYTNEYVSSMEATLNTVPDDLKDFSALYSQSEIDRYVQMFNDVSLNSADYTEYNQVYKSLKAINNSREAFTEESFIDFKNELDRINSNLPKNLDKTQQAVVDAATQALRDSYNILVATDVSDNDTTIDYDSRGHAEDGTVSVNIDNAAFKFMQTKDNQVFKFTQTWNVSRGNPSSGDTAPDFYGIVLDTSDLSASHNNCVNSFTLAANNTQTFVNRLTSDCYGSFTASDENGSSLTRYEFTTWNEVNADGSDRADTTTTTESDAGRLDADRNFSLDGNSSYYWAVSPSFTGNSENERGELTFNYVQKMGIKFKTGTFLGIGGNTRSKHYHANTTIQVTDVRQLISAVAEVEEIIANPGEHSKNYITALQAAVGSVPVEMLYGVKYYTQAEVDKLYKDITTIPENVADYSKFVETFEWMISENKDRYTEDSYNNFISEIYAINQNLPKNLTVDQQSTIDEAIYALYAAHDKLVFIHLNDDNIFTEDDIEGTLGNSPLEFSIATTQYNFMQVADGQKFSLGVDFSARKTRTDYNCYIRGLAFSNTIPGEPAAYCSSDDFCHHLDTIDPICKEHTAVVVSAVSGVTPLTYNGENVVADNAGIISEYTTWKNVSGSALSSGGYLIDNASVSTTESVAHAEMYFVGPTGDAENNSAFVDATYGLWFGWYYVQPFFGNESLADELYRHVHIPVNIKITDARALNALYEEIDSILNGRTETDYTFESLVNLYKAFNNVDPDMAYGSKYFTQEEVNAAYAELKAAYSELAEGADYSGYFEAYVKAEEVINTNNADSKGNVLYEDDAFNSFVENVTNIENSLDKNLSASEENQKRIDEATQAILDAVAKLEESKLADYSRLNDAMIEAEKIFAEEQEISGTYTQATLDVIQEAYNNALQNAFNNDPAIPHKELHADQQAVIDAAASALEAAIESKEYKADYSEFEEAYNKVQEIVDNSGKYTEETVKAAQDALAEADTLNKDLADTAGNRQIIEDATNALKDVLNNAEETADYTKFNEAYKQVEEIANDTTGKYTDATIQAAKDALAEADTLEKNLSNTVENQTKIDEATSELEEMLEGAQEKADYSGLDEAIKNAEDIVNAPDGTYTDETVKNAQDALDAAENLYKDLPKSEQETVDKVIQDLVDSVTNAKEKADYTDYNKAKDEADNLVNDDGNGNPIYDEEIFQQYKDAIEKLDSELNKDLSEDEQAIVDKAAQDLTDLRTELDATKGYEQEIIDPETTVDEIVDEVINDLTQNQGYTKDEIIVEFKDYTGKELAGEEFVGTGSTMRVILKSTGELLEYKLFIVMGDVDGNGQVNADDYNTAFDVALEMHTYSEENYYFLIANDMDEDTVIDVLDVTLIERKIK